MVRLPAEIRESLVDNIDNYLQSGGDQDPEVVAEFIVGAIEAAADEHNANNKEGVIAALETSGELESSLEEVLQEFFENKEDDVSSDEVLALIERICEIEWITAEEVDEDDDDEVGSGFFDDESGMFDDDE